jgi:HAD superfamily hydrolase (TIGR01509 family)
MLQAILFDMDGVLVDTEKYICEAAVNMFKERGLEVKPADFIPFVGAGENRYIGGVAEKYGFALDLERDKARTYEIYEELVKGRLEPLEGVHEFIDRCKQKGVRLVVATSADKVKMVVNLRESGIGTATFDALVNGLDVEHKKPHPEIYLTAAHKIGVAPEHCLVVEDAVNGVKAAKAAGARCLALTTSFTREELSEADWIAATLADAPEACLAW